MPTSIRILLETEGRDRTQEPTPAHVHAVISNLYEESDAEHAANTKPWAVAPPERTDTGWSLVTNWLPDSIQPRITARQGGRVRLGPVHHQITGIDVRHVPLAHLALSTSSIVDFEFRSPTWFARSGGEYPLPDPYLLFQRLSARWEALPGAEGLLSPGSAEELYRTLRIVRFAGDTRLFRVGKGNRTGFIGLARYALPSAAPDHLRRPLAALSRFAAFSGVGAMTTFGAGHVTVELA